MRITHGLNTVLERWLPEQRLFLKSDGATRFVRLSPATQLVGLGGTAVVLGWTIIASSILAIDALSVHGAREQAERSRDALEARLAELTAERDGRAAEALAAQDRFAVALEQVSRMQSQLLQSEARRSELETGLGVVQQGLQTAVRARDAAERRLAEAAGPAAPSAAAQGAREAEIEAAFDILAGELARAATDRHTAVAEAAKARATAEEMTAERARIMARNDEILSQLEDAVTVSVKPFDDMFRNVGMDPDKVLGTIRRGYSGQGGPLNPISYSTSGNAAIGEGEARANEILVTLDKMNSYRIAVEKLPLAMPLKSAFRYTSPFGRRWGRAHEGVDMAGSVGTPVYATAEGTVIHAGWQSGYGNLITIRHELGTETRYGHLSRIGVKVGQKVSRGSLIGAMGNTGRSTGPHLHYEVRVNGRAVNPMTFIKAAQNVF